MKELPKTAVRPLASGRSDEIVKVAERLISSKETLKVAKAANLEERYEFLAGLARALSRRGQMLVLWEDRDQRGIWYVQTRPLTEQEKRQRARRAAPQPRPPGGPG